jgi:hypothetical protein
LIYKIQQANIKSRKIFDVKLKKWQQNYGTVDGNWSDEISLIELRFEILSYEYQKESELITLESMIRDKKLNKII